MSNLWSGRACWAAVAALLINQASANPAIITTKTEAGYYDVSLNITHIDLIPGVNNWDDLAFTSLQEPQFSEYHGSMDADTWEKLAVLDVASGKLCGFTDGCMDDIASQFQSLCDKEELQLHRMVKRLRYIGNWLNTGWVKSGSNIVRVTALGALSDVVGGTAQAIIELTRSAICTSDAQGNQACLSWSGGAQAISKNVAINIIKNAQGTFGSEAVSGKEIAAVFDRDTKKRAANDVCISDRPSYC